MTKFPEWAKPWFSRVFRALLQSREEAGRRILRKEWSEGGVRKLTDLTPVSTSSTWLHPRALPVPQVSGFDNPASSLAQQKCCSRCVLNKTKLRFGSKGILKNEGAAGRKEKNENLTTECL